MKMLNNFTPSLRWIRYLSHHNAAIVNTNQLKTRSFHISSCLNYPRRFPPPKLTYKSKQNEIPAGILSKYKLFKDSDSTKILDVNEATLAEPELEIIDDEDEFEGINLNRGITGVFDIEDLVDVLRRENAKNIFVAAVPEKFKYVEYICIISGKSPRHMLALAEFVRKVFKRKSDSKDMLPAIEGKESDEWKALDLGNIALHIFSEKTRRIYDLESLWSVGSEYDSEYHKPSDHIYKVLERHNIFLEDLEPAKG